MKSLTELREDARQRAMWKLKYEVIRDLELVIAGTPTGPVRDNLTQANIILRAVADGSTVPIYVEHTEE